MKSYRSISSSLLAAALLLGLALTAGSPAQASPVPIVAEIDYAVTEPVCLLVVPGGSGPSFAEARTFGGSLVDATLRLRYIWGDEFGSEGVLSDYPADQIVLLSQDPGDVHRCAGWGMTQADMDTDQEGWTMFSQPPSAGGWSDQPLLLDPWSGGEVELPVFYFNSPDINGDGAVNLADVGLFAQDFMSGSGSFRSDFVWDGTINLADLGIMAQYLNAECP